MNYDTSAIRQFILKTFDDEEFKSLCFDYFRDVYIDLTTGMTYRQMVQLLLAYCNRHSQMKALMAVLQRERTTLYQEQFAPVQPAAPPTTPPRNPRQIFISHATADAKVAHRLAADLEAAGWTVWIAPDSINPGEKWVEAINRGLEESTIFALLLTPEAVVSRWVRTETNAAIQIENQGLLEFIPLEIKLCLAPPLWLAYQWIPFSDYDVGWQTLLARLRPKPVPPPRIQMRPYQREQELPDGDESTKVTGIFSRASSGQVVFEKIEPEPELRRKYIHSKSGLEMIHIPAGDFLYGEAKEKVFLPAFWISKTPVTNAHYARFVKSTGHRVPDNWQEKSTYPDDLADCPVVHVNWHDVTAYCEWMGGRLPKEEEWEKAARGVDGRIYPWGDEWRYDHCNSKEAGIKHVSRVGHFSPQGDSPYDCVDMSGNVWEWTDSWYDAEENYRVFRGGAYWSDKSGAMCTTRNRIFPVHGFVFDYSDGFRVCVSRFRVSTS